MEIATLAGGCFWCLEAVFQQLRGVTKVVSGYSGGSVPNPSYQAVCTAVIAPKVAKLRTKYFEKLKA